MDEIGTRGTIRSSEGNYEMKAIKKAIALSIVASTIAVLTPGTAATASTRGRTSTASTSRRGVQWTFKTTERGFTRKINAARRAAGRTGLRLDPELSRAARKHTMEMSGRNSLHHTPSKVLKKRVTNWNWLGENVGVGSTVSSLHTAFMNSPAHRDNILFGRFRHVGVGVRKARGRMWVTVLFEAQKNPGTTLGMPPWN
jgi:uncharacterized protein YkwD